eukprot:2399424-Prymnesium_polylepis.2
MHNRRRPVCTTRLYNPGPHRETRACAGLTTPCASTARRDQRGGALVLFGADPPGMEREGRRPIQAFCIADSPRKGNGRIY